MIDQDSKLIYEKYKYVTEDSGLTSDKQAVMSGLEQAANMLPDDCQVQWTISNGSFSGLGPHDAFIQFENNESDPKPGTSLFQGVRPGKEYYTVQMFIKFLQACWADDQVAEKHGLKNASYSAEGTYSKKSFWVANDTHFKDIVTGSESDVFDARGYPTAEYKDEHEQFAHDNSLTQTYMDQMLNNEPLKDTVRDLTPENFLMQKHWRISLSARSEEISNAADATYDSVGYGKGRYMGD